LSHQHGRNSFILGGGNRLRHARRYYLVTTEFQVKTKYAGVKTKILFCYTKSRRIGFYREYAA
jgi:hypothetical protein